MTRYNIVVIDTDGAIIGVEEYNPVNDGHREERIGFAIDTLAGRLGMKRPIGTLKRSLTLNTDLTVNNRVEWARISGEIEVGMVEIGFGKWGFESKTRGDTG